MIFGKIKIKIMVLNHMELEERKCPFCGHIGFEINAEILYCLMCENTYDKFLASEMTEYSIWN